MKLAILSAFALVTYCAAVVAGTTIQLADLCKDAQPSFCKEIGDIKPKPTVKGTPVAGPNEYYGFEKCAQTEYLVKCRKTCNIVTGACKYR